MEIFHVLNRGVDGRPIVLNNQDRARFVHGLFEFNDTKPAGKYSDFVSPNIERRQEIVDIHGWCLMKNHYHLLLSEKMEGGITLFIRKLNIGTAKYFNERYKRIGTLFQGRTKKIHINNDAHFLYILHYIHLNPLDYLKGSANWRERQIQNYKNTLSYLENYQWSSYLDYCGTKNFPSVIRTDFFKEVFSDYQDDIKSWLRESVSDLEEIKQLLLE